MEFAELEARANAERGVEVGEGLVEEEDPGVANDGAADGDTLALAAGELFRFAIEEGFEVEDARGFGDFLKTLRPGDAGELEREGHVVCDGHVRVEGVALEDESEAALCRRDVVDAEAVEEEIAGGNVFKAGDDAQQRGFTAAGRADEDGQLLIVDGEIDAAQDLGGAKAFADLVELHCGHWGSGSLSVACGRGSVYLTAPKVRPRTSCFWLIQPRTTMGAMAMVEAAESLA